MRGRGRDEEGWGRGCWDRCVQLEGWAFRRPSPLDGERVCYPGRQLVPHVNTIECCMGCSQLWVNRAVDLGH